MSIGLAIVMSLGICALSAALEGIFAGTHVKQYFAELRRPSYAIPLWGWYVIGALYYVICFIVLYRMFRHEGEVTVRNISMALLFVMMFVNAFWNYVFFRLRNFFMSVFAFLPYLGIALALFICLLRFDEVAAWLVLLYLLYLLYATSWAYRLWRLNRTFN